MKDNANGGGFSLIELLAGLAAAALIGLTAGIILVFAYRSWITNKATVERQQDGAVVMTFLARALRDGSNWTYSAGTLDVGASNGLRRFSVRDQSLYYNPNAANLDSEMLITSNVTSFVCSNATGGASVTLALDTGDGTVTQQMVIHLRN